VYLVKAVRATIELALAPDVMALAHAAADRCGLPFHYWVAEVVHVAVAEERHAARHTPVREILTPAPAAEMVSDDDQDQVRGRRPLLAHGWIGKRDRRSSGAQDGGDAHLAGHPNTAPAK
jgi:hypothetical protein